MDEKEKLISLWNSSQPIIASIRAKQAELNKANKWYDTVGKLFHSPSLKGAGDPLSLLVRAILRMFVWSLWGAVLVAMIPALIAIPLTMLIPPLADFINVTFLLIGLAVWIFALYVLPFILHFRVKKYEKEMQSLTESPEISWLPPGMRNVFSFDRLAEYIQYGRANSVAQAIELLDSDIKTAVNIAAENERKKNR